VLPTPLFYYYHILGAKLLGTLCTSFILPKTALSENEVNTLFELIEGLKKQDIGIIYISHKMDEIYRIADRITILRDGTYVSTHDADKLNKDKLISLMVGRELSNMYPEKTAPVGEVVMRVNNLSLDGVFEDLSFELKKGEILGVAGLMGSGRSEMVETIFGVRKASGGSIRFKGREELFKNPKQAINRGIALVTEDRKETGLNRKTSVQKDMTSVSLRDFCRYGQFINRRKEEKAVDEYIDKLNIKTYGRKQVIDNLSGGNQQKVIVARWLMANPDVFIIDEPTRGIDVGAKYEIYSIICELAKQGKATLMVSSELSEIIGICDRTIVMHEGRITGEINKTEMTQERIMAFATATENEEN
jgi:inositol transport system ATP-binding protein